MSSEKTSFFVKFVQKSAEMTNLAEGQCFNALLTLNVENYLIRLVSTRIPTVSMMEWQFILPLKTFTRNTNNKKISVVLYKIIKSL